MTDYQPSALTPEQVSQTPGMLLLDFGTQWCGHCGRTRAAVDAIATSYPLVSHIRIEDGPGRRLGRHFRVKLWPTLIFLRDGIEITRLVRPQTSESVQEAFHTLSAPA